MEYKTISEGSLKKFDEECKKLDAEGFHPLFGLCVTVVPNLEEIYYTQQWSKITP